MITLNITRVENLPEEEYRMLSKLQETFNYYQSRNARKAKYYEGNISLEEVNLGIAIPKGMSKLQIGCEWGAKTVDVLAGRSMFDGFVGTDGNEAGKMTEIMERNRLKAEYIKACRDELKFGCTFATLTSTEPDEEGEGHCVIRFHSPRTASALWDGEKGRIGCGLVIIDTVQSEADKTWRPRVLHLHTDTALWELRDAGNNRWFAKKHPNKMGRPLMEPLVWNATSSKPFGRSRIKKPIRRLIDGYVRTVANATLGLEFSTAPQKYLLGVTDDQYEAVINDKFRQYVGNIVAATINPDTGEKPTFGQLSQGTIEPHVQMMRLLATQFSAATGLTVTDTGVVNDANPTSSDAILAQTQTLVSMAEQLNSGNADALNTIARMAQAIERNVTLDELTDDEKNVIAHFKNPAMPSVAVTADAAIKIASARPEFAQTDVFMEMIGFDQADIRRIKAQEVRARGLNLLNTLETETGENETGENSAE